jgi:hypothetical protein
MKVGHKLNLLLSLGNVTIYIYWCRLQTFRMNPLSKLTL